MSTLKNNIYLRSVFYFLDFAGILSIIYINLNSEYFRICLNKYDIGNYIDLSYSWFFVIFVALKYAYIYITKDVIDTSIVSKTTSFFVKIILNVCSAGISFLSFKIYWLQTHYVDYIPLKFNFYIHRVWTTGDLRDYLCDVLLKQPAIVGQFNDLQLELPLSENVTSKLLENCFNLNQVETSLNHFIKILNSKRNTLADALDSSHDSHDSKILSNVSNQIQTVHTYLYDNNVYLWLAGLTVAVIVTVAGYYLLNSKVQTLSGETTQIRDKVVDSLKKVKENNNDVHNLKKDSINIKENISELNTENSEILKSQDILASSISELSDKVDSVCENTESMNRGLNDLSEDVSNLRQSVKTLDQMHTKSKMVLNKLNSQFEDLDSQVNSKLEKTINALDNNMKVIEKNVDNKLIGVSNMLHDNIKHSSNIMDNKFKGINSQIDNVSNKVDTLITNVDKNNQTITDNINSLHVTTSDLINTTTKQANDFKLFSGNYLSSLKNNNERLDVLSELSTLNYKELNTLKQSVINATHLRSGEGFTLLKQLIKIALKELLDAGEFGPSDDSDNNSGGGGKKIMPISGNIRGFKDSR